MQEALRKLCSLVPCRNLFAMGIKRYLFAMGVKRYPACTSTFTKTVEIIPFVLNGAPLETGSLVLYRLIKRIPMNDEIGPPVVKSSNSMKVYIQRGGTGILLVGLILCIYILYNLFCCFIVKHAL